MENECLHKSYFPEKWKQAKVLPLPKIGNPSMFSQLRSISVLLVVSKVLERIIEKQIQRLPTVLPSRQSGFIEIKVVRLLCVTQYVICWNSVIVRNHSVDRSDNRIKK